MFPSSQPTGRPSSQPTSSPTLTTESQWSLLLTDLYKQLLTGAKGLVLSTFGELLLENSLTFGGVADFYRTTYEELKPVQESNTINAVQLFTTKSLYSAPVFQNVTCSNPASAAKIVSRLANAPKYDNVWRPTNISCDGHVWMIHNCPTYAKMKLCVDCFDPCVLQSINSAAAFPYHCDAVGGCLQSLVVHSTEPFPPAKIVSAVFSERLTRSIKLTIAASDRSFVYCAASPMNQAPSSVSTVIIKNNVQATYPEQALFTFRDLTPSTNYTVYCVAKSLSGSTTSYADMIAGALPFSTACCKTITVNLVETMFAAGYKSSKAVTVTATDAPRVAVYVAVSHSLSASANASLLPYRCTFSPVVNIRNNSQVGSKGTSSLALSCGARVPSGTYTLSAALKGPSRGEFVVEYPHGNTFTVIDATTPITASPALQSAEFASDGAYVVVTFSIPTNRALLADAFKCSELFSFVGLAQSSCMWADARNVRIIISGSSKLGIGSVIALAAGSTAVANLKVACPSAVVCGLSQAINPASTISVQKPTTPVVAQVLISAASSVGQCQTLALDFSSCAGSGGRSWDSASVMVVSSGGYNTTAAQAAVQASVKTAPRIVLPAYTLHAGSAYTFYVTLCNFLGACGSGRHTVRVTNSSVPAVTVFGPPVRSLKASDTVSLTGSVSYTACATDAVSLSSALNLQWSVIQSGVEVGRLLSASNDPLKFLLKPYTLTVNQEYQVRLLATDRYTLTSAQFSVTVIVASSELYAVVSGGSTRNIVPSLSFELDASKSYDADLSPTARYNDILLRYTWGCQIQGSANASSLCPLRFDRFERTSGVLTVTPSGELSTDMSYLMTVSVTKDSRLSRASVVLVPQTRTTCTTKVLSPYFTAVNTNDKVKLGSSTSVQVPSLLEWSLVGNSQIVLGSAALTPVQYSAVPNRFGTPISYDLAVQQGTFASGSTYTFQLSCKQLVDGQYVTVSSATVDVVTNAPPASGVLDVLPASGYATSTPFSLTAGNWVDSELPITYQFSFVTAKGRLMTLRSRTEVQYAQSVLPAGTVAVGYNVTVVVSVYDALNANSSAANTARVTERVNGSTPVVLATLLSSVKNDTDQSKQLIGVYTSGVNQVNCTFAPDCALLNREGCLNVPHTCGACLTDYVGDAGDSNSPCFSQTRRLQQNLLSPCNSSLPDECGLFEVCVGGFCHAQNKTCPNSCSQHGRCAWTDRNTGLPVSHCPVTDFGCEATCMCNPYWYGTACDRPIKQQHSLERGREQLLSATSALIQADNADQGSVSSWIDMLDGILQVPDELSITAANQALSVLRTVIEAGAAVEVPFTVAQGLAGSLSNLQVALTTLLGADYEGSLEETALYSVMKQYGALIVQDLVVSQRVETVERGVRMVSASFYLRDGVNFTAPQLPLERSRELWSPQSVLYNPDSSEGGTDSASLSVHVLRAGTAKPGAFNTNPVQLFFHGATARNTDLSSNASRVEVTLQNIDPVDVLKRATRNITTICYNRRPTNHSYPCPGGFPNHVVSCFGQAGTIYSRCPFYFYETICTNTTNSNAENARCRRVSYNAHQTVCGCSWPESYTGHGRRYLSSAGDDDTAITVASSTQYRHFTFPDEFVAATPPVKPDRTFVAPTAMSVVFGAAVVLLLLVSWTDNHKWDVVTWSIMQPKKIVAIEEHDDLESSHYPARTRFQRNAESGFKSAKRFDHNTVSSRNWSVDGDLGASGALPAMKFMLLHALPKVFQVQNFFASLSRELLHHHRWISVVFHYSAHYPRWMRFICIATHINLMLLSNYLIIMFAFSNGRQCHRHFYEEDCLSEASVFDGGERLCEWDVFYNTCNNHTPQTSALTVIAVVVLAQLLSYPVLTCVEYALKKISNCTIAGQVNTPISSQNLGMARAVLQSSTRSGFNFGAKKIAPIQRVVRFKTTAQELLELEAAVQEHISGMELQRACVMLQRIHEHLAAPDGYKFVHESSAAGVARDQTQVVPLPSGPLRFKGEDLHALLTNLLWETQREYQHMESIDEDTKAVRVMQLFVLDLLPKFTAKVVAGKIERDRARPWLLPRWAVVLIWIGVAAVNCLALALAVYWSLVTSNEKQILWLNCLMFWLCFEPAMVNIGTVLTAHMLLPSLVVKGLQVAKQELSAVVDRYVVDARRKESKLHPRTAAATANSEGLGFNFAPYFMLSQRIAKIYPQLRESRVVQAFRTDLSVYASVLDPQPDTEVVVGQSRWRRWAAEVTHSAVDAFVSAPIYVQDALIGGCCTIASGLLCVLHVVLYQTSPGLLAIPVALLIITTAVLLVRNYKEKITVEGARADLVLTVHDNFLPVIDLVDTARDDVMQSKFFKQDGVHAMLAVDGDPDAEMATAEAAEQKISEVVEELPLHVILSEADLEYDPSRRYENMMEFRRRQQEREAAELLARAQANGPNSVEGMQLMLQSSMATLGSGDEEAALQRLQASSSPVRSVLPALITRPNLAKIEEAPQFTNVVKHKVLAISERIKSKKFTSKPVIGVDSDSDVEQDEAKPEERSWLPSQLHLTDLGHSDDSDDDKDDGPPRTAESTRKSVIASRMQNLRLTPNSRTRAAVAVNTSPKASADSTKTAGDHHGALASRVDIADPDDFPFRDAADAMEAGGPNVFPKSIKLPAATPTPIRKIASRVINVASAVKEMTPDASPQSARRSPTEAFVAKPVPSIPGGANASPVRPSVAAPHSFTTPKGGNVSPNARPSMQTSGQPSPGGPGARPTVNRFKQTAALTVTVGKLGASPSPSAPSRAGSVSQSAGKPLPGGGRQTMSKNGTRRRTTKRSTYSSSSSSGSDSSASASSTSDSSEDHKAGAGGSSSSSSSDSSGSGSSSSSSSSDSN
jgi:hypothetical protein